MDYYRMKRTPMELAVWRRKVAKVIAMQGDPYTGKTTLANSLAKKLECQVIHFDEILDALGTPTPEEAETLISQAFNMIAQMVKAQTSSGQSVIIDSPLSHLSHLHKLAALDLNVDDAVSRLERDSNYMEDGEHKVARRLIIIECKPKCNYIWESWFTKQASTCPIKWYKPQEWPFDHKYALDAVDDDQAPLVSKLVIDTTDFVQIDDVVDAVNRLTMANKGERAELRKEREERYRREASSSMMYGSPGFRSSSCSEPHVFRFYKEALDVPLSNLTCEACQKRISNSDGGGGVYTCWRCALTIHKSCAELGGGESGTRTTFSPDDFPEFLKISIQSAGVPSFPFPNHHPCGSCNGRREIGCYTCLFNSHLKWQMLPTILDHPGHKVHSLIFALSTTSSRTTQYQCVACRRDGDYASYRCTDHSCHINCHPQCALLPLVFLKHQHGGHKHDLGMKFQRVEEGLNEYACSHCDVYIHPKAWYYSCQTCEVKLHLECAFEEFDA